MHQRVIESAEGPDWQLIVQHLASVVICAITRGPRDDDGSLAPKWGTQPVNFFEMTK